MRHNENLFGNALNTLLTANKNTISRKTLAATLGVSESSISQWTNGKTFPEPDKLRSILVIFDQISIEENQRNVYRKFITVLEFPLFILWHKAPESLRNLYASDYVLTDKHSDLHNSMSFFYYELKQELYYHFQKQTELIKDKMSDYLCSQEYIKGCSNQSRLTTLKKIKSGMRDQKISTKLRNYTDSVKEVNKSIYLIIKTKLDSILNDLKHENANFNNENIDDNLKTENNYLYRSFNTHSTMNENDDICKEEEELIELQMKIQDINKENEIKCQSPAGANLGWITRNPHFGFISKSDDHKTNSKILICETDEVLKTKSRYKNMLLDGQQLPCLNQNIHNSTITINKQLGKSEKTLNFRRSNSAEVKKLNK